MLNLIKIVPARRAAMAALKPFVTQPHGFVTSSAQTGWLHPHVLGFLSTTVTLIAEAANGPFRNHTLAAIQASVLAAITGASAQLIGEEITLFSSSNDPDFAGGCQAAHHFMATLDHERRRHEADAAGIGLFMPERSAPEEVCRQAEALSTEALPSEIWFMNAHDLWRQHVLSYLTGVVMGR
jgi:hypothetical protein